MTYELTEDERLSVAFAADLALEDSWEYLTHGSPSIDYGDEWPEAAREKARQWALLATVLDKLGFTQSALDCLKTSESLIASAFEYNNPAVGN